MRRKIEDKLLALGITPNLRGFSFICYAIEIVMADPEIKLCAVYELVARKTGTEWRNVERSIRHCIKKTYKDRHVRNSEFIYEIALLIKREMEDESIN